jgi:hypothetical protein
MFCPKCAAQNVEGAKFCRVCGADISLVPQMLTGQLAERLAESDAGAASHGRRRRGRETPTIEGAVTKFFMGLAFILVALSVFIWVPMGERWWFWMLIPALIFVGGGIGAYLRVREQQKSHAPPAFAPAASAINAPLQRATELPPARRNTGELVQPQSVTEATTRHLATPVERPPRDA